MSTVTGAGSINVVLGQFGGLVGRGLSEILREDVRLRLLGSGLDYHALERTLVEHKPDVAIVDEACVTEISSLRGLVAAKPDVGLVVVVHRPSRAYAARLLTAGATCLPKDSSGEHIRATVRLAAEGHRMLTFAANLKGGVVWNDDCRLTPRQAEVLRYMSLGYAYSTIAHRLGISVETVRTHAKQVLSKLGVRRKSELIGLQGAASVEPSSCSLISLPPLASPQDPPYGE